MSGWECNLLKDKKIAIEIVNTITGTHTITSCVVTTEVQNDTKNKSMPETVTAYIRKLMCEWSLIHRSLRRSSGILRHSAAPEPGSSNALRASDTTLHTLNSVLRIVLASFTDLNRVLADVNANMAPNPSRARALERENFVCSARSGIGPGSEVPYVV